MPEDEKSQSGGGQQNKPQQSGSGGGSNKPQARSYRKSLFDPTNLGGAFIWLMSALLTGIALMFALIELPAQCYGARGSLQMQCLVPFVQSAPGLAILGVSLVLQLFITLFTERVASVVIKRIFVGVELLVNLVGIYWLFCIQFGLAPGVYKQVIAMDVRTFLWWVAGILLSIAFYVLQGQLFGAPPKQRGGGSSGTQRR